MKNSRHKKTPALAGAEVGVNEINFEEEIVMSDNSTAVTPDNLPVIKHAGRPVVTTALLARLYGADAKRIQNNFMRNAERFESGKHYYKLEGTDLAALKNKPSLRGSVGQKAKSIILWTERGAARHAKMLDTDEAWEVFEKLEDSYFKAIESSIPALPAPTNYTLIGTTIGTDGKSCLSAVIEGKISRLEKRSKQSARMHIWAQVHKAFSVVSAQDIPAEQMDAARNFIASYVVHEGEYLQAKPKSGIVLDQYETHHLYLLMSRFKCMHQYKDRMLSAAQALGSNPLMDFFDQLHDGHRSFATLDKRRDEIYGAYQSLGLQGGYMWRATA